MKKIGIIMILLGMFVLGYLKLLGISSYIIMAVRTFAIVGGFVVVFLGNMEQLKNDE